MQAECSSSLLLLRIDVRWDLRMTSILTFVHCKGKLILFVHLFGRL